MRNVGSIEALWPGYCPDLHFDTVIFRLTDLRSYRICVEVTTAFSCVSEQSSERLFATGFIAVHSFIHSYARISIGKSEKKVTLMQWEHGIFKLPLKKNTEFTHLIQK